jgi:hypothetical protein
MAKFLKAFLAAGALAVGLTLVPVVEGSETALNTHHFTFSKAVALPGAELPAGTYIFEQLSISEPDVVVVRSRGRDKVYFLGFTERVYRPSNLRLDTPALTLGESRPGVAAPITSWYPVGSARGHRFIYR